MPYTVDPQFKKVELLLPLDGADGSTTFTDVSQNGLTLTATGSPTISTTQSVFGGSSLRLPGSAYLRATSSRFVTASGGQVSFETRFRLDALSGTQTIFDGRPSTATNAMGPNCFVYPSGAIGFKGQGTFAEYASGASLVAAGTWYHGLWSFEWDGGTNYAHRFYLDGNYIGQNSFSGGPGAYTTTTVTIGADVTNANSFTGYLDDLRYTVSYARSRAQTFPQYRFDQPNPTSFGTPGGLIKGASARQAFAPPWPVELKDLTGGIAKVRNTQHGGFGQIVGTVKVDDSPDYPVIRRVRLFRDRDGVCVAEAWSSVFGNYAFVGFDPLERYSVVAYDHTGTYKAVISDNQLPTAYP